MARIRHIKPDFFRHHELFLAERKAKLPLRVAYVGLWTVADRRGRFRWKPEEIKTQVLPYDSCSFAVVLQRLEEAGFIRSYVVGGEKYGWIPTFELHQYINARNEGESKLPPPPETPNTVGLQEDYSSATTPLSIDNGLIDNGLIDNGRGRRDSRASGALPPFFSLVVPESLDSLRDSEGRPFREVYADWWQAKRKGSARTERASQIALNVLAKDPARAIALLEKATLGGYSGLDWDYIHSRNGDPPEQKRESVSNAHLFWTCMDCNTVWPRGKGCKCGKTEADYARG